MASLKRNSSWFKVKIEQIGADFFEPIPKGLNRNRLFKNWPPRTQGARTNELKKAEKFRGGFLHIRPRYPDYRLDKGIFWNNPEITDRSWRFFFQSLTFIDYLLVGCENEKDDYFYQKIKFICTDWWENSFLSQKGDHHMAWHDHAIAIRLQQFLKVFFIVEERKDSDFLKKLSQIIYFHTRILDEEETIKFYKHNHGLEQACSLYLSSIIAAPKIKTIYKENLRERSREWLQSELSYLMTEEGVQTENSPLYHGIICSDIYRLDKLVSEVEKSPPFFSKEIENNSLNFLTYITQPGGFLPALGDTHNNLKPNALSFWEVENLPSYPHYQYVLTKGEKGEKPETLEACWPKSGYYVLRDKWDKPKENEACQLLVKCGFKAIGHRHDDDGQVLLYGYGEPWLVDAGWYSYSHDSKRQYVLSHEAHNIASPSPFKIREEGKPVKFCSKNSEMFLKGKTLSCYSYMFPGYSYNRVFKIKTPQSFRISDRFKIETMTAYVKHLVKKRSYIARFMFPLDKEISILENQVVIKSTKSNAKLVISFKKKPRKIEIISGTMPGGESYETVGYHKLQASKSIFIHFGGSFGKGASISYDFSLEKGSL